MKKFLKEALEYFAKTCEFVYSNNLVLIYICTYSSTGRAIAL